MTWLEDLEREEREEERNNLLDEAYDCVLPPEDEDDEDEWELDEHRSL